MKFSSFFICTAILLSAFFVQGDDKNSAKKVNALLVTGGCCHDYNNQQWIVTKGISARTPVEWEILFENDMGKMREKLSKEGWADPYDIVVYNHCHAHEVHADFVNSVVDVHKAGKPAVVLHCSMHSFHWKIPVEAGEEKEWPQLLGVTSPNHGKHAQIDVVPTKADHPVMAGFPEKWTTPKGELYNITKTWPTATILASGTRIGEPAKNSHPCVWVNQYGKGRLFGTTLGHHNETMDNDIYLDLLTRGFLWSLNLLAE